MNLFPVRAIFSVLGSLMKEPMLLEDSKIILKKKDFFADGESTFHLIIFATIYNLFHKGMVTISPSDIDEYLSQYPSQYEVFNENSGIEWCYEATELADPENFSAYAEKVKKYSLLRELDKRGISLEGIYDVSENPEDDSSEAYSRFEKLSVDDIIRLVEDRIGEVTSEYQIGYERESSKAGDRGEELLDSFKEAPLYGLATQGELMNTIFRGVLPKTSMIRSALTNVGKCVRGDSIVFTDEGMLEIQDVINHYPYNPKTHQLKANVISYKTDMVKREQPTSHWYDMGVHDTIKIRGAYGEIIEGTPEHPVMVQRNGVMRWVRLDEITTDDYLVSSINNNMFGKSKLGEELSYALGLLFVHGEIENNQLIHRFKSKVDYEPFNRFMEQSTLRGVDTVKPKLMQKVQKIGNAETVAHLEELGFDLTLGVEDKVIPTSIMKAPREDVIMFLNGMFETELQFELNKKYRLDNQMEWIKFGHRSEKLVDQVRIMLLNLGVLSKKVKRITNYVLRIDTENMKLFDELFTFNWRTERQQVIDDHLSLELYLSSKSDKYYNKQALEKLHWQLLADENSGYQFEETYLRYLFNDYQFYSVFVRGKDNPHSGASRHKLKEAFDVVKPSMHDKDIQLMHRTLQNVVSSRVLEVTKSRSRVYDFTVPQTHSFLANGVISHNTRMALGEATDLAVGKIYKENEGWVDISKPSKVLFISTEMSEDELQPTMWAYVSGVAEEKIIDATLTEAEENRVREAIRHLQECELFIEYVPKFDPETINAIVKEYAIKHDIDVVYFDYVHLSFEIMMEISGKTRGMTMREDMMLTIFAAGLEELARQYNFSLRTATQMNGEQSDPTQMLDQRLLRGAKAMADKYQYGIIMAKPSQKELDLVEPILSQGFNEEPNLVYHIYKNRKSKWKGKLWLYVDFDTMRVKELFFTDFNHQKLNVPKTKLFDVVEETEIGEDLF